MITAAHSHYAQGKKRFTRRRSLGKRSLRFSLLVMKHVGTLFNRTATFALLLCAAAVSSFIQADPSDDFSFTLAHGTAVDTYWLMSEHRVSDIFADKLDLFPKSQAPKLARHLLMLCHKYRFD